MANIFIKQRRPVLEFIGQILLFASFIAAIVYGIGIVPPIAYGREIIAGLPIGLIVVFTLINTRTVNHILLAIGLAAATFANIVTPVDLTQTGQNYWLINIGFLSSLLIIFSFNRKNKYDISGGHLNLSGLIVALTMVFVIWIFPKIGENITFFAGYGALLLLTIVTGILSDFYMRFVTIGAIVFGIANLLMITVLVTKTPDYIGYIIWALTYLGELFIMLGIMLMSDRGSGFGKYRFD